MRVRQALFVGFFVVLACLATCDAKAINPGTELEVVDPMERGEYAGQTDLGKSRVRRDVMEIEERSIFDQLQAVARLAGDISRNDIVGAALDSIILAQALPLHPVILWMLRVIYKVLSFIHPAFWWLFPSTKPANVKGPGFKKISFF